MSFNSHDDVPRTYTVLLKSMNFFLFHYSTVVTVAAATMRRATALWVLAAIMGRAAAVWVIAAAAVATRAAAVRTTAAPAAEQLSMKRKGRRQPNSHEKWQTATCKQAEMQSARET